MSRPLAPHYADALGKIIELPGVGVVLAVGTAVPADGTIGYMKGGLFIDRDASEGAQVFVNVGTSTSCDFDLMTAPIDLTALTATVAELNILSGVTATATELNQAADVTGQVVTLSTTPVAITEAAHNNRTMYITKTDGIAITLPTPVAGMKFKFVVGATIAAASTIKSGAGTHLMIGHAILGNDSDNTVVRWPALAASTYDTINLFGTANSTGGIEGQVITITALSSTRWLVEIVGDAAGTEATPFEDTVA